MSMISQYWKHITDARLLTKETRFLKVELIDNIDCISILMPDSEADKFTNEMFQDNNNRLEFENDNIHMGWVFHVDRPYERFKPQPGSGTKLLFQLSPKRELATTKK